MAPAKKKTFMRKHNSTIKPISFKTLCQKEAKTFLFEKSIAQIVWACK